MSDSDNWNALLTLGESILTAIRNSDLTTAAALDAERARIVLYLRESGAEICSAAHHDALIELQREITSAVAVAASDLTVRAATFMRLNAALQTSSS